VHQKQHNIVLQQLQSIVYSQNWYCYAKTVVWEAVVTPVGGGARRAAAAQSEHQHPAQTRVPRWAGQGVVEYVNESHAYVHVKNAAEAHVSVLEAPGAGGRRYVCAAHTLHRGELRRILVGLFPEYPIPAARYGDCQLPRSTLLVYSQV
jgi:cinnamoyl-CoA reductase